MRAFAILAGLSALAVAHPQVDQNGQVYTDATNLASVMAHSASAANAAAASRAAAIISSERAGQTLSGAAASQASHNAAVLSSALAAQTAQMSTISAAEQSVLSEQSKAMHSLSEALATATGKFGK